MANKNQIAIGELKEMLKNFIDNGGDNSCNYCDGEKNAEASDNPRKASIALSIHREAPYQSFITIQDEIAKAYFELRENYLVEVLKKDVDKITEEELIQIQAAYPFNIIEVTDSSF